MINEELGAGTLCGEVRAATQYVSSPRPARRIPRGRARDSRGGRTAQRWGCSAAGTAAVPDGSAWPAEERAA